MLVVYGINSAAYKSDTRQGLIFLLFGSVAAVGALFSWLYLPDLQRVMEDNGRRFLETKDLEELGGGRRRARHDGEIVTFQERWQSLRNRRAGSYRRNESSSSS